MLPGCVKGTCSKPLECKCLSGWRGFLCEQGVSDSSIEVLMQITFFVLIDPLLGGQPFVAKIAAGKTDIATNRAHAVVELDGLVMIAQR